MDNKRKLKRKKNTIAKITKKQIEAIEREYYERYNSGIVQWQQQNY